MKSVLRRIVHSALPNALGLIPDPRLNVLHYSSLTLLDTAQYLDMKIKL